MTTRWDVLRQRRDARTVCSDGRGWTLRDEALLHSLQVDGATEGEGTRDRWPALDAMPLVLREVSEQGTRSETVIGTVHYDEYYELMHTGSEPRT